jgi:hypothetical protein
MADDPIVAIVGNIKTHPDAPTAAEALGAALAKARIRILVYSSGEDFLECRIVKGYVGSQAAGKRSVQVRYPLHGTKAAFVEQQTHPEVFDWRPDPSPDWEVSFYQSLSDADGVLLVGGGDATKIAGVVAMGHGIAILTLAGLEGAAARVWERLRPGRDLPNADEISLMGRPWSADQADEFATLLNQQIARKATLEKLQRVLELQKQTSITWRAGVAVLFFILAVACVPIALAWKNVPESLLTWLLFFCPLLAGVAGSTIRLVFDASQRSELLSPQSATTTAALGLIAGGIAGLLFITSQITTATPTQGSIVNADQARKLVLFGVLIGFVAGLTLDAVFRKLISSDVVDVSTIEVKKRP